MSAYNDGKTGSVNTTPGLRQLLRFGVQGVHHFAHAVDRLQRAVEGLVGGDLIENS